MAYSELIKNFEKIRKYMREFYVYGFKSRDEYDQKSPRSYDDEKRRIESWLGDYMKFTYSAEGKRVFISIDSRLLASNPFYNALKSKSFTDGDITLHFILFDILYSPDIALSIKEIMEKMDGYLSCFKSPMVFDESTVRKKLKEYQQEDIIECKKVGKKLVYSRKETTTISNGEHAIDYFSEVLPCGVIGSFIKDKQSSRDSAFLFKHHYITSAIDSDVLSVLFVAISEKSAITVYNENRKSKEPKKNKIVPLRIFISVQTGRQYLLAFHLHSSQIRSYRIDHLSNPQINESVENFDELRDLLDNLQTHMWGVNANAKTNGEGCLEHVDFTIKIEEGENHIANRLYREKRIGEVTKIDDYTYKFSVDTFDSYELLPFIRTFIGRIVDIRFSNRKVKRLFKKDLSDMYSIYGLNKGGENNGV